MAEIQRTIAIGADRHSAMNADMDTVFEALNSGTDPTAFPPGKITADKFNITTPGTGSTGFRCSGGQIAAGAVGVFSVGIQGANSADLGPSGGQFYIATPYADFFIDPTGAGPLTINNIYTGNASWSGIGSILPSVFLRNSSNASPQLMQIICAVHNFDSVAHYVYVTLSLPIINTPTSL